ncbi:hypothetical protein CC78DRAFT_592988 [Lojkania enalia]|uniref:Uncharacterized protein n=1 Tax=Lojkania enalia TaxID=147567 RepID=A0A9P4JYW5_9PLEO|nr:hypothetical protein CC78DRAFT_592988 [Didymosphaeria enalia]
MSLTAKEKAIKSAYAANRSAKSAKKRQLQKSAEYMALGEEEKKKMLDEAIKAIAEKRFNNHKSGDWLEARLKAVYLKWEHIDQEISLRRHQAVLLKATSQEKDASTT